MPMPPLLPCHHLHRLLCFCFCFVFLIGIGGNEGLAISAADGKASRRIIMVAAAASWGGGGGDGATSVGWEMSPPPSDGITNLCFSTHSDHLLVSSWDAKVRLYDASANVLKGEFWSRGPVLDCCFHDDSSGYSASADNSVSRYDFNTGSEVPMGSHEAPVCSVEYSHATGQLVTGSWDRTIRCWDARGGALLGTYVQPDRVSSMSLVGHRLVVATKCRHIIVYDLRQMSQPEQSSETHLRFQTRRVCCYPNGTGYAVSSIDGRVIMDFFDVSEAQAKKYAFRCHRKPEAGPEIFYPVNALAFHPLYGTLATGGGDRHVNIWDGNSKKRLFQYSKCPSSIAALAFSRDGQLLAVGSSYTFEEGEELKGPINIYVRSVSEAEVKPKRRSEQ